MDLDEPGSLGIPLGLALCSNAGPIRLLPVADTVPEAQDRLGDSGPKSGLPHLFSATAPLGPSESTL
eukprot:7844952-Lingulodinium_polyedra.AAC.1